LNISAFFLNRSIPVYYIDTDEFFIPKMDNKLFEELLKHYKDTCKGIMNMSISTLYLNRGELDKNIAHFVIFSNKKKYIFGGVSYIKQTRGVPNVDNYRVLAQNKKYFGRNYDEIFPEYAI
jgi:hypothetical protein